MEGGLGEPWDHHDPALDGPDWRLGARPGDLLQKRMESGDGPALRAGEGLVSRGHLDDLCRAVRRDRPPGDYSDRRGGGGDARTLYDGLINVYYISNNYISNNIIFTSSCLHYMNVM